MDENKIYMDLYVKLKELGYDVYIGNPKGEVDYPFIHLGEQIVTGTRKHKEYSGKDTDVTVHVWHNSKYERGTLFKVIGNVELLLKRELGVKGEDIEVRVLGDPEDLTLIHGVIEVNIKI